MERNRTGVRGIWWIAIAAISVIVIVGLNIGLASNQSMIRDRCEVGHEFVFIPAGKFIEGSDRTERDYGYHLSAKAFTNNPQQINQVEQGLKQQGWFEQENPRQIQSLPAFCIQRNLITNADYQAFIQATGHRRPGISEVEYQQQGFLVHSFDKVQPYLWNGDRYPTMAARHPVVLVSYDDAISFARWKGQQDHQTYRLPTTKEWEKTARGMNGSYFPWGNQWQDDATNWAKNGIEGTSEIATFPLSRSIYGVEDMAGNVFEYTSTLRQQNAQRMSVMKGCSWDDSPGFCRSAYQHTRPLKSRHILFGFRLVRE